MSLRCNCEMATHNFVPSHASLGWSKEMQVRGQKGDRVKFLDESTSAVTISESAKMLGLRHRFRQRAQCADIIDHDDGHGDFFLRQRFQNKAPAQSQKMHGFAGCIEKFLSACRSNVKMLLQSTCRRGAKFEYHRMQRASPESQAGLQQDEALSCLGRARRWDVRRIFGDIIKIEEDIVYSVPRSVLYYV